MECCPCGAAASRYALHPSVCFFFLFFWGDTLGAWPFGGASPVYSSECRGHRRCNPDAEASVPARKAAPGRTYPRYFGAKLVFFYTVHKSWVEKMPHTGGKRPRKCREIVQKCGRIFRKCGKKIAFPRTFHHRCARHPGRRAVQAAVETWHRAAMVAVR